MSFNCHWILNLVPLRETFLVSPPSHFILLFYYSGPKGRFIKSILVPGSISSWYYFGVRSAEARGVIVQII